MRDQWRELRPPPRRRGTRLSWPVRFILSLFAFGAGFGLGVVTGVMVAFAGPAAPTVWIHDANGRLAILDLESGRLAKIGRMSAVLTDIAFAPDGRLYGVSFDALYEVDRGTGALRRIGRHAVPCGNAFEIGPNGVGYAMGCSDTALYTLDLESGATQALFDVGYASAGDLAYADGRLMLAARGGRSDLLVSIDPQGGAVTRIGSFALGRVYGLVAADDGTLYAGADTGYYRVDRATGYADPIGDYGDLGLGAAYGWAIERAVFGFTAAAPSQPPPPG